MLVLHERSDARREIAAETLSVMLAVFGRINPALRKSITFDNDTAFAQPTLLRTMRDGATWFCDAYASWQKGGVFAKLFEDPLERRLEAQAFSWREIGGYDGVTSTSIDWPMVDYDAGCRDVLDFLVGHLAPESTPGRDQGRQDAGQQFAVHPTRSQHLEMVAGAFGAEARCEPAVALKSLHTKIGELTLENDLLEGAGSKLNLHRPFLVEPDP